MFAKNKKDATFLLIIIKISVILKVIFSINPSKYNAEAILLWDIYTKSMT